MSGLARAQREQLEAWLPGHTVVRDHSWGLVGTTVVEVTMGERRYIVKAGDEADTHIAREAHAHHAWLDPFLRGIEVQQLVCAHQGLKMLVLAHLEGDLVQGSHVEHAPEVFERAGAMLARLHGQRTVDDGSYAHRLVDRAHTWLAGPHRLTPAQVEATQAALATTASAIPTLLVPTHGDYSPRNWLHHEGEVRVIDFGRAALRPAMTDLVRLHSRYFAGLPHLEAAFLGGYGSDPRTPAGWWAIRLCEAVGTLGWAHAVGDRAFEAEGIAQLEAALACA